MDLEYNSYGFEKFYANLRGEMNKMLYLCRPIGYIHSDATKKENKNGQV